MTLKYFDVFNGIWKDIQAQDGETLVWDSSGFTSVNQMPYKKYVALLSQSGTGIPEATILENTIGEITYDWISTGHYVINSDGLFTSNKTMVFVQPMRGYPDYGFCNIEVTDTYNIKFDTFLYNGTLSDDMLLNTGIEIRVYNTIAA